MWRSVAESLGLFFLPFLLFAIYLALLAITTGASALYPVLIVGGLPIAGTLRNEVVG